ncbi:MAG: hypothetical protein ACE5FG_06940 [Myxococcota bacterium]
MRRAALGSLLALLACTACGPRVVRETVLERPDLRVELRHVEAEGRQLQPEYDHPVTIADVRVAHILASLVHEDAKGRRQPTIRSEHVYGLAEGIAQAATRAGPQDEIAAVAFITERRMMVFRSRRVTAFRAFFQTGQLVLEFYAIEDRLEQDPRGEEYAIPLEAPQWRKGFSLVAGPAQRRVSARRLHVDWRSPQFARPLSLRSGRGGAGRRTILLEAPPQPATERPPERPENLEDEQIQALDQLEAARRAGIILESEFQRRRALILEGRLEEAGYGTSSEE